MKKILFIVVVIALILAATIAIVFVYVFAPNMFKRELEFIVSSDNQGDMIIESLNDFDVHNVKVTIDQYESFCIKNIEDIEKREVVIVPFVSADFISKGNKPNLEPLSPDYYLMDRVVITIEASEGRFEIVLER